MFRILVKGLVYFLGTSLVLAPTVLLVSLQIATAFGGFPGLTWQELPELLGVGCVYGIVLGISTYALALPFLFISTYSPFFRVRMHRDFSLKPAPVREEVVEQ
jgi:hypothetical protein